jgi:DNA-binding transcriptional ArsR family regulator
MARPLRYEWDGTVRRLALPPAVKLVAAYASQYADNEGKHIRPGVERLALETGYSPATVKRSLKVLRDLGLLVRVRSGSSQGRRAVADEYRLVIPADILDRADMVTSIDLSPVDNRPDQVSPMSPDPALAEQEQGSPDEPRSDGTGLTSDPEQGSPVTPHQPVTKPAVLNTPKDHSLNADHSRAEPVDKCPHGLPGRRRPDGSHGCALCRRALPAPDPTGADVIDLDSRREHRGRTA